MKLSKAEIHMIQLSRVCRVATANQNAVPHNVPVCPLYEKGKIYFASAWHGKKVLNVQENPDIAVIFDDYAEEWSNLRGIMIQGRAKIIRRGPLFRKIRRLLYLKYQQYEAEAALEEGDSVVIEITLQHHFSWGL